MKLRSALAGLIALVPILSCSGGDGGVAGVLVVSVVEVTPGIADVVINQTRQFSAAPKTSSGIAVPGRSVTWSSSDVAIASVSSSGLVTGVAIGGPVRIRATVDGVTGDALLTVRSVPVDRVTISPPSAPVLVGQGVQLTATAFDAGGAPLAGRNFSWESSDPAIAAVTTTGIVIGLAQGGPVTISATSEGKTGTATVSVSTRPATRLGFSQQPGPTVAGSPMTPVKVALQDDLLATVIGATNPVTIALAGNLPGATLGGSTVVDAVNGIATFGNLTLDRVGTGYTFLVTSPGLVSATSIPFDVSAGAAGRLSFTTAPPVSAQSGIPLSTQPVVQLRDVVGNPVALAGVLVTATLASGTGTLGGSTTATTNGAGTASFTSLSISGLAGNFTLSFGATGVTPVVSAPIALGPGTATALSITTQPTSSAQSGVPLSQQPVLQIRDAAGNAVPLSGVTVTAVIASGSGTLGGATAVSSNAGGQASFASLAINGPSGTYTLGFTAAGLTGVTSTSIVLGAGAPTQLGMSTQPSAAAASGAAFAQQPAVQLKDGSGNPVALAGIQITASISSGTGTLLGISTATTNSAGTASFGNLAIQGPVGSYTLIFFSSGLTPVTSSAIAISAGAASQLALTTQPSPSAASGAAFAQQPVVQIRDAAGNPVSQAGALVTVTLASGPAGATLGGTTTATSNGFGAATFTNLAITGPSGTYTLQFSATGLTSVTSGGVTLGAGAASQLAIATQPSSSAQSGIALAQQPAIQLRDGANNPVSQAGVVVTAAIASGGGTLGGTATATTNGSGVATFSNLSISGLVGVRTLSFSSPGLAGATSTGITISAGTASQLVITTQPSSSAASGAVLATQPVLQLQDADGNPVSQGGVTVTVTIATGGGTLGGTAAIATGASGSAAYAGLSITGTAGDRTLSFSATGLTGATSSVITITAGSASQLSITTQPSSSTPSGAVFGQQPVIQLRDAASNPVAQAGVVVTASISSGGGTLGGTVTATTNGSGVATFTNLSLTGTVGPRTLLFSAPGFTSVTSATITVTAGVASQLTITTQPSSSAQSGVAFAQQPVIQVRDASGNAVSQSGIAVTAVIASGGGSLGGTASATTNASGVATYTNLSISGTTGNRTLTFSATGLTSVTSTTIGLTAGPASKLTITTQPSSSAQSGVAFPRQPVIQLRDASNNAVGQSGVVVTAVIASGGGSLGGTSTATTNASGVATFSDLSISGTIGNRTLTFSAPSLTSVTSATIGLTAGPASQLTITTQPSSSAQSGVAFPQQPVLQLRDASGNAVSQSGVNLTAAIASGGPLLTGTLTVATNASGVATYTNLAILGLAGDRTLGFSASGLTGATSGVIAVTAGSASQLSVTTQPSGSAQSGVAFGTQPVIQLRDASNNPVSQSGVVVTAAISSGGGSLGGTATASTNASGVATFTNLSISGTIGDRTLIFSASGYTSVTSNTITVTAGAASQLAITTQPSSSAQNAIAFGQQPVIQLRDASGNDVSQSGVVVTAVIATGGGVLGGTLTATTSASGAATFTDLKITGTVGSRTLAFSATGLTGVTSATVSLTAGNADHLSITTQPPATATSGAALTPQPVLQLRDVSNNAVGQSGIGVNATIASGPSGTLGGSTTVITDGSGTAAFSNLALSGATGSYTLGFGSSGLTGATSTTITLSSGAGTALSITTQPSSAAQSGVVFATQPVIQLRDGANNPVATSGVLVTASIQTGGGTLGGTATVATDGSGVATFTDLKITGTAGDRTLLFAAAGYSAVASNTITVGAGPATQVSINTQPPTTATNDVAFTPQPAVLVRDASSNPVSGTVVTAAITGAPAGVTLIGTVTATSNGSGLATFTGLGLKGTAASYTLTFTANGGALSTGASNSITLSAGAAAVIAANSVTTQSAVAGTAVSAPPSVKVTDTGGNPVSGVAVAFAVTSGGGSVVPAAPATVLTDGSGVATATSWTLGTTAGANSVSATSGTLTGSPVSFSATGTAGAPATITIFAQPSATAFNGVVFSNQPAVTVKDAGSNNVAGAVVTVTISTAPAGTSSLMGTLTATTAANGRATFSGLGLIGPVGNYKLQFSASGGSVTSAETNPIALSAGAAAVIAANSAVTQSAPAGTAVSDPPSVKVTDSGGNPKSGVAVTFAVTAGGGVIVPAGPTTVSSNASGIATATSWTLGSTAGSNNNTATASATGLSGTPVVFTASATAGAATQLTYNSQPSAAATNDVAFAAQPVILVQDAGNNPVSGVVVTAEISSGPGGVLIGTVTATSNGSGLASFSGLGLKGLTGSYTLTFTANAGALSSAASNSITLGVGAAAVIAANSVTTQSATVGTAVAAPPSVKVTDTGNNPVPGVAVTFDVTAGGGSIVPAGPSTVSTDGSGIATASSWTLGNVAGTDNNTATASATGLSGTPVTFTASGTAGAATQLSYDTQPSAAATQDTPFPQQPVILVQDAFNNPVNGVLVTAAIGSGTGATLGGTLTATSDASGKATFSGLKLTGTAGSFTLLFTANAGAVVSPASITITLSP